MISFRATFRRLLPGLIVFIALLGLVFIIIDWQQIRTAILQASWQLIPYALAATALSYLCISLSFAWVSKLLGVKMTLRDLTLVGFTSTVLNHVVSSGGAAGYSVRFALMHRHGVAMRDVLAVSFFHFYLTSLVMIAMLPVGLLYLVQHVALQPGTAALLAVLAGVVILATLLLTLVLFSLRLRQYLIRGFIRLVRRFTKRDLEPSLMRLDETLAQGVSAMRQQPISILIVLTLVIIDWSASAATLWLSFRSLGIALMLGQVITGFVIGIVAGVASMIPGGLGVQEGSMAGIFALLGVSFDRAVLASVLFRVIYFFVPYLISLTLYRGLLRQASEVIPEVLEVEHANPDA
ncbi:MAG: flippase-like domain-containing protein [Anaerolineales bacterium]